MCTYNLFLMEEIEKIIEPFYIPRDVPVALFKAMLERIYTIEVTGLNLFPSSGGAILVCNHTDSLDIPIQAIYLPRRTVFLGKYEIFNPQDDIIQFLNSQASLFSAPPLSLLKTGMEDTLNLFGKIFSGQLKHWGGMPIMRNYRGNDAKSAVAYYEELENYMCDILKSGEILSIFPEGTRTETGVMAPFKALAAKLAIKANVPIIPAGISGAWKMSSPQAFLSGAAFKTKIVFNVGNPIPPDQFPQENEKKSAKKLTEEIEKRVYYLTTHWERRGQSRRFATVL
jgi:1-acyl-sn-glycerol-3-phosphate acyltransferase